MTKQPGAQLNIDAIGGVSKKIGPHDAEHCFEHSNDHQTNHNHVQSGQGAVHQDLVNDDLK